MSKSNVKKINHDFSRREFLQATAVTAVAVSGLSTFKVTSAQASSKSQRSVLQMGGYKFDRTKALAEGKVNVEGYDVSFEEAGIGDLNTHVFSGAQTIDVTEIGLHPYMLAFANENFRDYMLLPIFPLRLFRHKSVFIRNDRGIKTPHDLKGKKIATAGYSSTSLTWIRGIFQDEYGLRPEDMQWVISRKDSSAKEAGKVSKQENIFPKDIPIIMGPEGKDESDLLESGEVDACFHASEPRCFTQRHPQIARLFPDYRSTEQAFYAKTGIFPMMHAVAIKKSLVERDPAVIKAVFNAYSQAKQAAYDYLAKLGSLMDILPWIGQEFEETKELMGANFYSYGTEPNRAIIETLFRYSYEQGLCKKHLKIEEVFPPESLELAEA
jgi:4,5-dihydroxyphthalate decarboxylase